MAVCGSSATTATSSGICHLAILPSKKRSSSSRETLAPGLVTTTSSGRSSHFGWRQAMTAASCTAGCAMAMFSRSMELIHSPPDLMTSLLRSVMNMKPSASMAATSPVGNQPGSPSTLTSGESAPLK